MRACQHRMKRLRPSAGPIGKNAAIFSRSNERGARQNAIENQAAAPILSDHEAEFDRPPDNFDHGAKAVCLSYIRAAPRVFARA